MIRFENAVTPSPEQWKYIYKSRKDHKLDEWAEHKNIDIETLKRYYAGTFKLRDEKSLADIGFCDWIKTLPYSELITGEKE